MSVLVDGQTKDTHPRVTPKGLGGIIFQAFKLLRNRKKLLLCQWRKSTKTIGN